MTGIGAVEGFVAQGEIGDDVALDGGLQQRPLEPRGIAQVTTSDPAISAEADPSQDVAAEAFDQGQPLAAVTRGRSQRWDLQLTGGLAF